MTLEEIKAKWTKLNFYIEDVEWLINEVERLQQSDLKIVLAYEAGMKAAALRCAEMAEAYYFSEKVAKYIKKEFNL